MSSGDCSFGRLFTLCAGSKQFQQHGVALTVEFVDRAIACLFLHAVNDRLLNLGTEFGDRLEVFPPRGYRPGEVIHEMVNSARTTSEVEQEIRTHHSPAQSGSPAYGSVR